MNKKLLVGSLSLAVIGLGCLSFISKPTYKTIDNSNLDERMAVYIKNDTGNYEKSNSIPTTGYILNEEKSTCNNNAKPTWNKSNKSLKISNLSNDNTSCYLYFDELEGITSSDIVADAKTETPDFSQIANTDEGIYAVEDGMYGGTSYYYRGAVTNNYVKFGGFCWRIVRINGDGSIRMIYDGTSCHANGTSTTESIAVINQAYNSSSNKSYYVGYTYEEELQRPSNNATAGASNLKTQTESWYQTNIIDNGYDIKVADGKFCNDRNTASGSTWAATPSSTFYYVGYERLQTNKAPTLACPNGDVYTLKAGAITADEVGFAGGVWGIANRLHYLYNGQHYWTMSPHMWNSARACLFSMGANAQLATSSVESTTPGIRPVINLRADTIFKGGTDGTLDNPYIVEGA